jgi:hypothetical protein
MNLYRMKLVKVQEMMTKYGEGSRSPGSAMTYEEKEQVYLDRIQEIYKALLPHEKAKLQSITHLGDPAHPVYHEATSRVFRPKTSRHWRVSCRNWVGLRRPPQRH